MTSAAAVLRTLHPILHAPVVWNLHTTPLQLLAGEYGTLVTQEAAAMTKESSSSIDPDLGKGATEDDRRDDSGDRGAPGLDENGLPNDPTAIAQDAIGAREDKSQG